MIAAIFVAGCSSKPQDLIIGKWKAKKQVGPQKKEIEGTVEFQKDSTLKIAAEGHEISGKYVFVDDNTIEVEMTLLGMTKKDKSKVSVTKDTLTVTDSKGEATTYMRDK
jgi:hypothetical protein